MTGIPVAKGRFSNNKFKGLYLKKERLFMNLLLHLWNVHEIYNILEQKNSILA